METPNRSRPNKSRRKIQSPAEECSPTSITDLPEAILIYIFSFLPTATVIKTSAVAPPWRYLWCSLPSLDFNMQYFQKKNPEYSDSDARFQFASFVTRALSRRPIHFPVQKFKLLFFYRNYEVTWSHVDYWVRYVVANRVVELDLVFVSNGFGDVNIGDDDEENEENDDIFGLYEFDFSNIVSSSIEVLKLSGCDLLFPRKEVCMKLKSIKELHLGDFDGDANEIEQLMTSCVNLETFVLVYTGSSSPNLKIVSDNLRHLAFKADGVMYNDKISLEICTPRLETIEFGLLCCGMYTLTNVSSLVEAKIDCLHCNWFDFACWKNVISSLTHIERLSTCNHFSKFKYGDRVLSETLAFHNLKHLTLKMEYMDYNILSLEYFLNKCPRLETLVLVCDSYSKLHDRLVSRVVTLRIPHLREVRMEEYFGSRNELYLVDLFKKHGQVLEKIVAIPAKVGKISPPPFLL